MEYQYRDDHERKETQKYEGIYTAREIELNKKLYEECFKESPDYGLIEDLLKKGADPLGGAAFCGWDLLEHIYGDAAVCASYDFDDARLPRFTEVFLQYGMDVDKPRIPYDGQNSLNPLWHFAHVINEHTILALKMLLDHGLSAESFAEFWSHAMTDFFHIECGDPQNDEFWNAECTRAFKMLLLGASYDHILESDARLREFICCDCNSYDIHNFRQWENFSYFFDTSHCKGAPALYGSVLRIYDKTTHIPVWQIGVGVAGKKALENAEKP